MHIKMNFINLFINKIGHICILKKKINLYKQSVYNNKKIYIYIYTN